MQRQTIGVDLAKNVFELAISRRPGKVHQRKRLSRARLLLALPRVLQRSPFRWAVCLRGDHGVRERNRE